MSYNSSPPPDGSQPPYRRLKLLVSTAERQQASQNSAQPGDHVIKREDSRSSSPTRPSYSPVTPTLSHPPLNTKEATEPEWIDEPAPLPVSLDENPDAIALQATLSLLQMQRQQSLKDIRGLDRLKQEALEAPEAFVEDLKKGKLSKPTPNQLSVDVDVDDSDEDLATEQQNSRFGKLPTGQNIARCPPIEWSKYRIASDSLNRLHEMQKRYPGTTEDSLARGFQPQPHEIAAPYRPFKDQLDSLQPSTNTRNYDR